MVFVEDTGSVFNVPFYMIWKLEAHIKERNKIHPNKRKQ